MPLAGNAPLTTVKALQQPGGKWTTYRWMVE
jgi:glycerol-3-phosphate dehydrogenase